MIGYGKLRGSGLALVSAVVLLLVSSCTAETPPSGLSGTPAARAGSLSEERQTSGKPDRKVGGRRDNRWVSRRPSWLGKRVLAKGASGFGVIKPTPPIMRNRRFATIDILPTPDDRRFSASIQAVPRSVVKRSTWRPRCPVGVDDLAYVTMSFWGFDHRRHTGEMIVNSSVAEQVVDVFRVLYSSKFPIEEMRVITLREQRESRRAPTGDTNVTSSFECRKATLGSSWSAHAYGLAIDINPFHNPYLNGELVAPELSGAYTDRSWRRPGMIFEGDVVTKAFDAIGWGWGGRWSSLKDWMHFSQSGN